MIEHIDTGDETQKKSQKKPETENMETHASHLHHAREKKYGIIFLNS